MNYRTILFLLTIVFTNIVFAQEFTIKFATLAPDGSTWMNVMKEFDAAIRKESKGRIGFKMYAGGVQGDEKDVLRKVKLGQLHSAGITGVGIGDIAKQVRILDAPFLFKTYDEVDAVRTKFSSTFTKAFDDGGYILLGFAEVGFVYTYTNTIVRAPSDLQHVKMWMWEGDPIAEAMFNAMNISPIPLSITDVMTSLQTKLIDGVYASPLAAIALQWFTRTKYMLEVPLADAQGAVVIAKKMYDKMPADMQEILTRNGKLYMEKLTKLSREDNAKSIETLKKNGVQIISLSDKKQLDGYDEIGKKARRLLVGKLYDETLLTEIEKSVAALRTSRK